MGPEQRTNQADDRPPQAASPTSGLDVFAVLADMQAQLDDLRRAVQAQQTTIDGLVDATIDLLKPADANR
jgi:hypothetical protein